MIRIAFAVAIGILIVVLAASTQPHFKAGSLPDFVCDLVLLPGGLFAAICRDRGNASPEFLWREWVPWKLSSIACSFIGCPVA